MEYTKNQSNKKSIYIAVLAAIGSGLEYYDFVVYGMMVRYLGDIFFPSHQGFIGVMQAFSIFAVGYFIRPIGGVLFGMIADHYGRKKAFIMIMLIMAFSTFGIGLLPTYQQVGLLAPILLITLRLLQGISLGAELPSATTLVTESSSKGLLGKLCGLVLSGMSLGSLLAALVLTALTSIFDYKQVVEIAWRIPFLFGGILAIFAYYIRKNVYETSEFLTYKKEQKAFSSVVELLKGHIINLFIAFGLTTFLATLIIINLYFPVFISKYFTYELPAIYKSMSISMVFSFLFMGTIGFLSDYVSKLKMLSFGLFGFIFSLPVLKWLLDYDSVITLDLFFITYQFWISVFFVGYLPILSRLFPTKIRCTGIALTYNIAFSMASTIPTISTYFFTDVQSPLFILYFFGISIGIALLSLISLSFRYKASYVY